MPDMLKSRFDAAFLAGGHIYLLDDDFADCRELVLVCLQ